MNRVVLSSFTNWRMSLLLAAAIIGGLVCAAVFRNTKSAPHPFRTKSASQPFQEPHAAAWEKVAPRLQNSTAASARAGDKCAERIEGFFAERKLAARPFAEALFSIGGKWAFVKSKLPFAEEKTHDRYLREAFERHLFKAEDLKELVESVITAYISELDGIQSAMLVAIRADLTDGDIAPPYLRPVLQSDASFQRAYAKTVDLILPVINRDMKVTVGREVSSIVAADIATNITLRILAAVTARLGVSAGILGTGAALSVETLGIGLCAAFLADMALDWVIHKAGYDPEGDVARKVCETLDKVKTLLLEGDAQSRTPGLRAELQKLRYARSKLCTEALRTLILKGGKS